MATALPTTQLDATIDVNALTKDSVATSTPEAGNPTNPPTIMSNTYKYKVQMTCGGCSGAVTRVLQRAQDKNEGVTSFTVSLEDQSVIVHGPIEFDELTNRIAKTGKKILEKEQIVEPVEPVELVETPSAPEPVAAAPVAVA